MTYDVVTDTAGMCLQVVLAPQLAPVPTAALRISALLVGGLRWRLGRRCAYTGGCDYLNASAGVVGSCYGFLKHLALRVALDII